MEAIALAGVDRQSLADHLGITIQAISALARGRAHAMTAENCARAARYLGVDAFWLATGEGQPRPTPPISPMAAMIASDFDRRVPVEKRDAVYAQVMGTIDLASPPQRGASQLPAVPTAEPTRGQ